MLALNAWLGVALMRAIDARRSLCCAQLTASSIGGGIIANGRRPRHDNSTFMASVPPYYYNDAEHAEAFIEQTYGIPMPRGSCRWEPWPKPKAVQPIARQPLLGQQPDPVTGEDFDYTFEVCSFRGSCRVDDYHCINAYTVGFADSYRSRRSDNFYATQQLDGFQQRQVRSLPPPPCWDRLR
jgi:hypothetical protein